MNAPDTKPLLVEYDRSGNAPTRRQFRILLILTFANTLLLGWFVAGPQTGQILKQQWDAWQARRAEKERGRKLLTSQQRCLEHTFPADLVIYDEDASTARRLLTQRGDYYPMPIFNTPVPGNWPAVAERGTDISEWRDFASAANNQEWGPVLFLGERRKPNGERTLVVVQIDARAGINVYSGKQTEAMSDPLRVLTARAFKLSQKGETPDALAMTRLRIMTPSGHATNEPSGEWRFDKDYPIRLLAGQADTSDLTHVSLPYQLNAQPGVLDLYLQADGLIFKLPGGDLTVYQGTPAVQLSAPPTTNPS